MTPILFLFLFCAVIQLLYWLGIFLPSSFDGPTENRRKAPTRPPVSIVVCAHNQLPNLKQLVPALLEQQYPDFEVIIVNDRSEDGTEAWLRKQQFDVPELHGISISDVPQGINPKKHALVRGIATARHDILLLTDADCVPESDRWIDEISARYREEIQIVLGYSGYQSAPGLLNKVIRFETLVTAIQYLSRALKKHPYMGVGRNLSYRKSFFNRVSGLQQVMGITGGDDDLLVNQHARGHNTAVCISPQSRVISIPKTTWPEYFRQKVRHLSVGKYYRSGDKWLLGIFSASHIIFWSSLVSLLITHTPVYWVAAGFIIRQLALSWAVGRWSRKLGERISMYYVPLLDFLYSLNYLITGLVALFSRKISWH